MDDEREGTKNPLSQDDGELDIKREKTDYTELANARAKEAMERLEGLQFASREARRKRKEAWEKEQKGTIHLSDTVDMDPEMIKEAGQEYDQFGQPINNPAGFDQFGQPMGGYSGEVINGNGIINPMQSASGGQMGYGAMPNGQMNGMPGGQIGGNPQMMGQMGVVTNLDGTVPIASLDPTSRPMRQVPTVVVQKPKKIRKGWLIAISASAFIAVALAVLAVLIVVNNKPDAVVKAIEQMTTGGLAENVEINGGIDFDFSNESAGVKSLTVDIESSVKTSSLENTATAKITADMKGGEKLGVEMNEIYAKNYGIYLKFNKLGALIKGMGLDQAESNDTSNNAESTDTTKTEEDTKNVWTILTDITAKTDGKWLRLNGDGSDTAGIGNAKGWSCEAALINNLVANQKTLASIYHTFPFISSTTKGVELSSEGNTVYKVNIDINNLTSFFNGIESMKSLAAYEECRGLVQPAVVGSDAAKIFEDMQNVYVEVSEDYRITRVYFEYAADWGEMVADFYLSYPETVRIEAPDDAVDLSQITNNTAE